VQREVPIEIVYMGKPVGRFRIDMLVDNKVLVEVKSTAAISDADTRQLFNYLHASKIQVGLLLHYGPKPAHRRFIWTGKQFHSKS
jgi:GxxExxY protein